MSIDATLATVGQLVRLVIESSNRARFRGMHPTQVGAVVLGLFDAAIEAVAEGAELAKDRAAERLLDRLPEDDWDEEEDDEPGPRISLQEMALSVLTRPGDAEMLEDPEFRDLLREWDADPFGLVPEPSPIWHAWALRGAWAAMTRRRREGEAPREWGPDDYENGPSASC